MSSESLPMEASAEHLTDVFRRAGVLGDGRVCDVVVESTRTTILSRITRLVLTCQGAASTPRSVILKTSLPRDTGGATWNAGRKEVAFYAQVAPHVSGGLIPRCFDAQFDPDTNRWHILLEDLAESHVLATEWPLPPTMEQCNRIMATRAAFHAAWWNDPRLGVSVGTWLGVADLNQYLQDFDNAFGGFSDFLGDRLPRERREFFREFIDAMPRLFSGYHAHANATIVHGDAHVWNCFLPRDERSGDVRLFDWDGWRLGNGSVDLAYMMAVHWYPDLRRERERLLLNHYHDTLVAHGVSSYDRRALNHDYRYAVLRQIMTPVWQMFYKIPTVIWWNNLQRILLAVDDLDCRELLG